MGSEQQNPGRQAGLSSFIQEVRSSLSPEERAGLDKMLQDTARQQMRRYERMQRAVLALDVLHGEGEGDRAGFCTECGNVVPCQTRKFIAPFLDDRGPR